MTFITGSGGRVSCPIGDIGIYRLIAVDRTLDPDDGPRIGSGT
jgi:hypothetical protein